MYSSSYSFLSLVERYMFFVVWFCNNCFGEGAMFSPIFERLLVVGYGVDGYLNLTGWAGFF